MGGEHEASGRCPLRDRRLPRLAPRIEHLAPRIPVSPRPRESCGESSLRVSPPESHSPNDDILNSGGKAHFQISFNTHRRDGGDTFPNDDDDDDRRTPQRRLAGRGVTHSSSAAMTHAGDSANE